VRKREILAEHIYTAMLFLTYYLFVPEGFIIRVLNLDWNSWWELIRDFGSAYYSLCLSWWVSSMFRYKFLESYMSNKNDYEED